MMGWMLTKAHAYGNDFLYMPSSDFESHAWPGVAREVCARHTGAGADGLILYWPTEDGARMRLFNADGSHAEVSGNGVRALGALLARHARERGEAIPPRIVISTDAGDKTLDLLDANGSRFTFRASMGQPEGIERRTIDVGGTVVDAVVLRVGNPQCVVLEPQLDEERYRRLGPALESHAVFPAGTNVEFAAVESPTRVNLLIWERGVGPTLASGTGACASAVAAMAHGGAERAVDVVSPGGMQRVEWTADGLFLTGWAEVIWEGQWTR
jgi:diaminopimelate epimerase